MLTQQWNAPSRARIRRRKAARGDDAALGVEVSTAQGGQDAEPPRDVEAAAIVAMRTGGAVSSLSWRLQSIRDLAAEDFASDDFHDWVGRDAARQVAHELTDDECALCDLAFPLIELPRGSTIRPLQQGRLSRSTGPCNHLVHDIRNDIVYPFSAVARPCSTSTRGRRRSHLPGRLRAQRRTSPLLHRFDLTLRGRKRSAHHRHQGRFRRERAQHDESPCAR